MTKFVTKQRILCFGNGLSFIIAVAMAVAPAGVAAAPIDDANMAYAEEESLAQVLDARLALERWNLEQLLLLQSDGNASWREVARQQTLIDTLQAERTATFKLVKFFESLRDCVKRSCTGSSELQLAEADDDLPAIKLTLPGSQRLVVWLEWDQASEAIRASYLSTLSVPPAEVENQYDLATEKVAKFKQKASQLAAITGSEKATHDLARTKLELVVAGAELDLTQVMRKRRRSDSARLRRMAMHLESDAVKDDSIKDEAADTGPSTEVELLVATNVAYITHQSDSILRTATLGTAAQEARTRGTVRAAEINLRRLQRRADDVDQLHAAGLATRRNVQDAREEIDSAMAVLVDLRAQQSTLIDSYESLRQLAKKDDFRSEPIHFTSTPVDAFSRAQHKQQDLAILPRSCFADAAVVRHVIDLSRQRSQAEASRGALLAKLKMLENLEARLVKAEKSLAARRTQASDSAHDDMRAVLADGRRRELENARLNIELKKAQLLAAAEQLEVLRLETDRFSHQITQQFSREDGSARSDDMPDGLLPVGEQFVAMVAHSSDAEHAVTFKLGRLQSKLVCYLESHETLMNVRQYSRSSAALGLLESVVAFQPIWLRPFRHLEPLALAPWQPPPPSVYDCSYNRLRLRFYGLEPVGGFASPADLHFRYRNCFAYSPRRFASPLSSYFDEYDAFGDRRAVFVDPLRRFGRRRPVTYLPGIPERLPGAPRYLPGTPRRYE